MVVFPTFPLYRPGDDEVTPEYAAAIDRIFRTLDLDRDGLLSRDEFTLFQMHVGALRLPEAEVDAFFDVSCCCRCWCCRCWCCCCRCCGGSIESPLGATMCQPRPHASARAPTAQN